MLIAMAFSIDTTSVDIQVDVPCRSHMRRQDKWFAGIVADQGT